MELFFDSIGNTAEKPEYTDYQHIFFLTPHCFYEYQGCNPLGSFDTRGIFTRYEEITVTY